ncbi:amino acid transporter, partial [Flavihumibacter sediminis]|nr:amino acid transporter [Flavihumibacter sediminis]
IFPSLSEKNILIDAGYIQISSAQLVAILVVVILSFINTRGVKEGKLIQTTFTLAKLLALFGLIVFGFLIGAKAGIWDANWADAWSFGKLAKTEAGDEVVYVGETVKKTFYENWPAIIGALSAAMVGSVFSSDAWNNVTF